MRKITVGSLTNYNGVLCGLMFKNSICMTDFAPTDRRIVRLKALFQKVSVEEVEAAPAKEEVQNGDTNLDSAPADVGTAATGEESGKQLNDAGLPEQPAPAEDSERPAPKKRRKSSV